MDGAADRGDVRERLSPRHRPWGSFATWLAVGVACAFSAIALASVGLFVFPVAVLATLFLARRTAPRAGLAGLVVGFGFPPLYVAFLNRDGPGRLCSYGGFWRFSADYHHLRPAPQSLAMGRDWRALYHRRRCPLSGSVPSRPVGG